MAGAHRPPCLPMRLLAPNSPKPSTGRSRHSTSGRRTIDLDAIRQNMKDCCDDARMEAFERLVKETAP